MQGAHIDGLATSPETPVTLLALDFKGFDLLVCRIALGSYILYFFHL
jgi:hypothetical protein